MTRLILTLTALTLFATACTVENGEAKQAQAAEDAWTRLHNEVGFYEADLIVSFAQVFDGYRSNRAGEGVLLLETVLSEESAANEPWLPRTVGVTVQRNEPWSTAAVGDILIVACRSPQVDSPEYSTRCWIRGFATPEDHANLFDGSQPFMFLSERARQNMSGYTDNPWPLWVGTTPAERRAAWSNL